MKYIDVIFTPVPGTEAFKEQKLAQKSNQKKLKAITF
jgi:hypothetical protein